MAARANRRLVARRLQTTAWLSARVVVEGRRTAPRCRLGRSRHGPADASHGPRGRGGGTALQQKAGKGAEGIARRLIKEAMRVQQRVVKRVVTRGGQEYVLAPLGREGSWAALPAKKLAK
jgi:hypothetical protein